MKLAGSAEAAVPTAVSGRDSDRLRVLVLTSGEDVGGAEIAAARLTNALAQRGVIVRFVSASWSRDLPLLEVPHHVVGDLAPSRKHRSPIGLRRLAQIIGEFQPHVVHSHHRWLCLLARAAQPRGVPVVWHSHFQATPSRFNTVANHIIAVSEHVAQHLRQQSAEVGITTILNAMPPTPHRALPSVPAAPRSFLFAGRLAPGKGAERAIAAVAQVPGATLLIAGDGPLRRDLEALARRLGCASRVAFLGWVSNPMDLEPSAFLFPSELPEGLPLVILEAMAAGKTVISTTVGGVREVLDDQCAVLITPDDRELLEAMMWVMHHPGEATELGQAAREKAARYDTNAWAEAVEACLAAVRWGMRPVHRLQQSGSPAELADVAIVEPVGARTAVLTGSRGGAA